MLRLSHVILQLVLFCGISLGSVYYVDNVTGNDGNSGTTDYSPWKSISKVNSFSFLPGDRIQFRNGQSWYETLNINTSGTQTNPIVYSNYGEGELPLIDGSFQRENCVFVNGVHDVVIENLHLQNNTGNGTIKIQYSGNIETRNNIIYTTGHGGLFIEESSSIKVTKNNITTPEGNYAVQTDGIYSQRNFNNIYRQNTIVISNAHPTQHVDGIQSYYDRDLIIYSNLITHKTGKRNAQGIYTTAGSGTHLYFNNVLDIPHTVAGVIAFNNTGTEQTVLQLFHNTVIGFGGNVLTVSGRTILQVENNIFVAKSHKHCVINIESQLVNSVIDYNLFDNGGNKKLLVYQGDMKSLEDWRSLGFDTHSRTDDPRLTQNYTLALGSPALDMGINLGGVTAYDKGGNPRPPDRIDIGAYENLVNNLNKPETIEEPQGFELAQNFPNPFNPATTIKYSIPDESEVTLKVYDIVGNEVATLVNTREPAGTYSVQFDAAKLASGVYIYRITAGRLTLTRKMTLLK